MRISHKPGAILVGQDRDLAGEADQIGKWNQQRQGEHRLAAGARDRYMDHGLHHHHAHRGQGGGELGDRGEQTVDDGVHDLPLVEHDVDRTGKPDQERGQRHRSEAIDEGVGGAGQPQAPQQTCQHPHRKEKRGKLVELPAKSLGAVDVDGECREDGQQYRYVAPVERCPFFRLPMYSGATRVRLA